METSKQGSTHTRVQGWWRSPLLWLASACFAIAALFAQFASEVIETETGGFDRTVREWVSPHRGGKLEGLFHGITLLGDWAILGPLAAALAGCLVNRGARRRPVLVVVGAMTLAAVIFSLKSGFRIGRPDTTLARTYSFPSGHTTASTAIFLVGAFVLRRELGVSREIWIPAVVVPLLVGLSRVALDMHWASDVVGGWLIGASYAAGTCALYEWARRRSLNRVEAAEL